MSNSVWPHRQQPTKLPRPGILQARTLEWAAISFSNAGKWKVKVKSLSRVWPSATPWTAAYQAPPFMGFSRQEYWSHFNLREVFLEEGQESGEGFWGSDIWTGFLSGKWTPGKISRMCKDRRDASVNDTKLHFLNHIFINLKMTYVKNRHWKVRNKERF